MSFTTSADISTFIQAATKAAGRTALGVGTGDAPSFAGCTMTGQSNFNDTSLFSASAIFDSNLDFGPFAPVYEATAMAALSITTTKRRNTKTISADSVFTFSGAPNTGQAFSLEVTNSAGAAKTLTIPSSFSVAQQGAITSVSIPANGYLALTWAYDGATYYLYGDPPLTIGTGNFVLATGAIRGPGFTADGGGSALTTGKRKGYVTVPSKGTITGWSIGVDTGTCTVKVWKVGTGTAVPTIANVINTNGVAISSGTYVRSTTVTDFTSTAVAAGDILAFDLTAVASATEMTFELEVTPTA